MLITGAFLFPMAGYAASASPHLKLHMRRRCVSKECLPPHSSVIRMQRSSHQIPRVPQLSARNPCEFSTPSFINAKVNPCPKNRPMKIYCLGTLVNSDGASVFEWVPVVDQALLMASIFLTHMAGVLPAKRSLLSSQNGIPNDRGLSGDSLLPGRDTAVYEKVNLKLHWDIVEEKLMDALSAIEDGSNSGSRYAKFEESSVERPLSLYAIAEAARFRLLWASFRWLKQEVGNISGRAATVSINDWSIIIRGVIQKSCQPIFMAWLEKELSLKSMKVDKELPSVIDEKLTRDDSILRNIRNSGKEDLYAELAQFLVFGSLREGCCYDGNLFIQHGVSMLEDFVITLADGVASVYVELISVDSNMSNEINFTGLILCNLSTRELQKLRNEVALNQWLHQNMKAVVSMYEDRFDLCTLQSQVIEESKNETENFSWWKKLTRGKSAAISSPLRISVITYISVTVKRTKELRALTGWRYYFSLFLELADITMPLIRTLFAKVSDAISFLLVCLIGRSLGLIYTGIRQSLRWK